MSTIRGERDVRTRFETYRNRAHRIVALVQAPHGQYGTAIGDTDLAEIAGMAPGEVTVMRHILTSIGAVQWDSGNPGTWHVLKSGRELDKLLDDEMERQMRGGQSPLTQIRDARRVRRNPPNRRTAEKVAVQEDRLGFAVGAVVGPDAPQPMHDLGLIEKHHREPEALVLAAKQYVAAKAGGDSKVARARELMASLEEIGVPVPPELRAAATAPKDDRLETVALVLPYIEALERKVVNLSDQLRKMPDVGQLQQTIQKQRSQIERLVAERTQAALQESPRR